MKKNYSNAIILILFIITSYLIYDKVTTKPTITNQEQKPISLDVQKNSPEIKKVNHECLISAENFFEKKRAENIDYYSATWNEYYQESSGICFVTINGIIYNVNNGDVYNLVNNVFTKVKN